jgi:hypothetical protein
MTLFRLQDHRFERVEDRDAPDLRPVQYAGTEKQLERWIEGNPELVDGLDMAVLQSQPITAHAKIADLLGINADGDLVVIELKRGRAGRNVLAQVLEYAAATPGLSRSDLDDFVRKYKRGGHEPVHRDVGELLAAQFPGSADHRVINERQRVVIFAHEFDAALLDSMVYLRRFGVGLHAVRFQLFDDQRNNRFMRTEDLNLEASLAARGLRAAKPLQTDESIIANAKTAFMRSVIATIRKWIGDRSLSYPDLELVVGKDGWRRIMLDDREVLGFRATTGKWIECFLRSLSEGHLQLIDEIGKGERRGRRLKVQPQVSHGGHNFIIESDAELNVLLGILAQRLVKRDYN